MIIKLHPLLQKVMDSDLSEASKNTYLERTRMIKKCIGNQTLDSAIQSPEETYSKLSACYSDYATLSGLCATVLALVKHSQSNQFTSGHIEAWRSYKKALNHHVKERTIDGSLSKREKEGWVTWDEVIRVFNELGKSEYGSNRHLVLAMYVLLPPGRHDYHCIEIVDSPQPAARLDNYLLIHNGTMTIYLNIYKTAKRYGSYEKELPRALQDIIRLSLNKNPRKYLFPKRHEPTECMQKDTYRKFMNNVFRSLFNKPVTVNILRHSFITSIDYNKSTPRELMQYAKDMRHSIPQQMLYRRFEDVATPKKPTSAPRKKPPIYKREEFIMV
jgi:integrase